MRMSDLNFLSVLVAPVGVLSGDGQLRESFQERRDRKGSDFPLWYLTGALTESLGVASSSFEAVVAEDATVITWLNIRFGGEVRKVMLPINELNSKAMGLPAPAPLADIGLGDCIDCDSNKCKDICRESK